MERRSRDRIRNGCLTIFQVVLADHAHLAGRLVDISESGFQFAVECPLSRNGEHGGPRFCDCGATSAHHHFPDAHGVMSGVVVGPHLDRDFLFHGSLIWTRRDPERNRMFGGFRFIAPKELPLSFHLVEMDAMG